jgi:UDP-glucose 4-epimerase
MYFTDGQEQISDLQDYTSHNTQLLTAAELKKVLLDLDFIKQQLN